MSSPYVKRNFAENHYYRLNHLLLSILQLWPYRKSKFAYIHHTFHFTIMISFVFFQLTSFLTSKITVHFCITLLSYAVPSFAPVIQYYPFYAKPHAITWLWTDMHNCWSILKNESEREIMRKYASFGELCTKMMSVNFIIISVVHACIQFSPIILDVLLPLNQTRRRQLDFLTEYFVDETTYYFPIVCHWLIGAHLGIFVFIATDAFLLIYVEYVCGLLKIACYRMEHCIDTYAMCNSSQKENIVTVSNITAAVDMHRKALRCNDFLKTTFMLPFILLVIIGVLSLSLNLYLLLEILTSLERITSIFVASLLVNIHFGLLFLLNYYGQKITDHNTEFFNYTCNIRWYTAPTEIQKLLLFVLKNTVKPYFFCIGNIISVSMEGFSKLVSMSISYFTVIYSLQ